MPTIVIMQGAQGSGKSHMAAILRRLMGLHTVIISTDHYFTDMATGAYNFDPSKLGQYHKFTQEWCQRLLDSGRDIIVDNCNSCQWEAKPYVAMAVAAGYSIEFVRCDGRYPNVHGVPDDKVQMVRDRMETLTVEDCLIAKAPWEK
jgi:predicted kinase